MFAEIALVNLTALATPALQEAACTQALDLSLSNATVTAANFVPEGPYSTRRGGRDFALDLPAHCRVSILLTPSVDSHIEMELWLPTETWNGKFLAVGNGGWAGSISYFAVANGVRDGYATASNDTGHKGGNASFAIGHPEKVVDFAHRAMHEMTVQSKVVIDAFYENDLSLSYYSGCSTGGRQGLMSAQRYPTDFDAIVAGAPANPQIQKHAGDLQRNIEILTRKAEFLPREKLEFVYRSAVDVCDTLDGVKDGLISDPAMCSFDPGTLVCGESSDGMCLTPRQVEAVRVGYAPMVSGTGELVYDGYAPGTERQWGFVRTDSPSGTSLGTYGSVVYQDSEWDWRTFDIDRDMAKGLEAAGYINATTDLTAFKASGGKLLLYHGWSDGAIVPQNTIRYYTQVLQEMGERQEDWLRLFMVPGMAHCRGGDGPDQINWLSALERWDESEEAPDRIVASRVNDGGLVDMTRPLCPYPQVAKWAGVGSTNDAENFSCEAP